MVMIKDGMEAGPDLESLKRGQRRKALRVQRSGTQSTPIFDVTRRSGRRRDRGCGLVALGSIASSELIDPFSGGDAPIATPCTHERRLPVLRPQSSFHDEVRSVSGPGFNNRVAI